MWRLFVRSWLAVLTFGGVAFLAMPAAAQQIVETSTGKHIAGESCSISEAMLTEIEGHSAAANAETRQRLNVFLDAALASPKTRKPSQSPVVFTSGQPRS